MPGCVAALAGNLPGASCVKPPEVPIVIVMNRKVLLLILLIVAYPDRCCAQSWGWPPANYTANGTRYSDCSKYRGLCDILRDRGWGLRRRQGGCAHPCCEANPVSITAKSTCGCGGSMARGSLAENQEPPLRADPTNDAPAPTLLPPEEMHAVDLDSPAHRSMFNLPDHDRQ